MGEIMAGDRSAAPSEILRTEENFRWQGVECLAYKEADAAPFKKVSRQILFSDPHLQGELRYFEVGPGGYSTLERHAHMHAVMVLRGEGQCLAGDRIHFLKPYDLVTIAPWSWHQFRAGPLQALGFLCLVNASRDRPQLPDADDLARLQADPAIAAFLDGRIAQKKG